MKDQCLPGIGPTSQLSLRVSVATLARVLFPSPEDGEPLLALEHKATVVSGKEKPQVLVKAQPFGGAVRIRKLSRLMALTDGFNFDSHKSRSERDFRILIRPADWEAVREYCLHQFELENEPDLEIDPSRELGEEFAVAMGIMLRPDQYVMHSSGTVLENEPAPSGNVHATGMPTVRVYRIFAVNVTDPALGRAMVESSENHPPLVLHSKALADAENGGPGWANALFVAPLAKVQAAHLARQSHVHHQPMPFEDTLLDRNVGAIMEGLG